MDASKLYNITFDLVRENKTLKYDEAISSIINGLSANNSENIKVSFNTFETLSKNSFVNRLSPSNYKIYLLIDAHKYFGLDGFNWVNSILTDNSYNNPKIISELQIYQQKRNEFINTITALNNSFKKLEIDLHFYSDDSYELGLIFPESVTKNSLNQISKEFNKWDQILRTIHEIKGEKPTEIKIDFVNHGSIEVFFENSYAVATCLMIIIERITKLYKNILEIRLTREKLKSLGVPESEEKQIKDHENKIISNELEKVKTDIVENHFHKDIDKSRKNELSNSLKLHIEYIAKSIDKGIIIEITPPEIEEPSELNDDKTPKSSDVLKNELENYEAKTKIAEKMSIINEDIRVISDNSKEIFKYLTEKNDE